MVFSGNIQDHLRELFKEGDGAEARGARNQVERHIRNIIKLGIVDFSAKNKVADDTIGHLLKPPLILRLEREFLRTPDVVIEGTTLSLLGINTTGERITFAGIAEMLRKPGPSAAQIAQVATELGVSAFADIYA